MIDFTKKHKRTVNRLSGHIVSEIYLNEDNISEFYKIRSKFWDNGTNLIVLNLFRFVIRKFIIS